MRCVRELARITNITTAACVAALLLPAAAAAAPKAPVPSAPADDAKVEAIGSFSWKAVKRADRYQFQLAADSKFGSIVLGKGHGSFETRNRYATIDESLGDGNYFWRVRAINRKDQAGKWSHIRSLRKSAGTAPKLVAPADESDVQWPGSPLVLRGRRSRARYHYQVVDRHGSLARRRPSSAPRPSRSRLPGRSSPCPRRSLPGVTTGRSTPLDAQAHRGARSAVGSFEWTWNSATTARLHDLRDDARVIDPQLSWDPVLGAAGYEVEVNNSDDWAAGLEGLLHGPDDGNVAFAHKVLPNNRYYWRVRAFDPDGNAGSWNVGVPFDKDFDNVVGQPTVTGLHLRDNLADPAVDLDPGPGAPETEVPIVSWDPVPGASSYEVQVVPADYQRQPLSSSRAATGPRQRRCDGTSRPPPQLDGARPLDRHRPAASPIPNVVASTRPARPQGRMDVLLSRRAPRATVTPPTIPSSATGPSSMANGQRGFTWRAAPQPSGRRGRDACGPLRRRLRPARPPAAAAVHVAGRRGREQLLRRGRQGRPVHATSSMSRHTHLPAYAPRSGASPWTYPDETTTYYWAVCPAPVRDGAGVRQRSRTTRPQPFRSARSRPRCCARPRERRPGTARRSAGRRPRAPGTTRSRSVRTRPSATRSTT